MSINTTVHIDPAEVRVLDSVTQHDAQRVSILTTSPGHQIYLTATPDDIIGYLDRLRAVAVREKRKQDDATPFPFSPAFAPTHDVSPDPSAA